MSSSNCCFLTCMERFLKSQVRWYDIPSCWRSFQFVVIHTVKGFSIFNEADVFLEFPCFFYDPMDVGHLLSGSFAFSKSSLYIWKFLIHVLLKPSLENFEHYFASVWNECSCVVVWTFFGIALLWYWNGNWPFPVLWPLLSFPNLLFNCYRTIVIYFYSIIVIILLPISRQIFIKSWKKYTNLKDDRKEFWHGNTTEECHFSVTFRKLWASLVAQMVKNLPAMQETQVQSLRWEDPLEKGMASLLEYPLQYSCLKNPMDRGAWQVTVHGVSIVLGTTLRLVVQSLSCVQLFATQWTAAHQASLSFSISRSLLKLMSIELGMPSNHVILQLCNCCCCC